jgi:hypothetical protein
MNTVKIEIPDIKEAFEKVTSDMQAQFKVMERQHQRRKLIMYCSLAVTVICITIVVIKCLN